MAKITYNEAQKKIIGHREGNMIVSASAGSGKTTVMLERVLRIIEEGTPIDRIVILAFNNSIAAEIRGKMYKELVARLESVNDKTAEFIKEQIDRLPFCNIITNDAYCNSTSSEFFQVLGIDPKADILGEVEKGILFRKNFSIALSEFKEVQNSGIFELSLKFGGDEQLLNQVLIIHNYVSTQAGGMEWLEKVISGVYTQDITKSSLMEFLFEMVDVRVNRIIQCIVEILQVLKDCPKDSVPYQQYLQIFETLLKVKDYDKFYTIINSFVIARKISSNRKIDIDRDRYNTAHDEMKEHIIWLKDMFSKDLKWVQMVHQSTINDITLLVDLYKKTLEYYANEKVKTSKYDFTDFTSNLIKLLNNPDFQKEISSRYDYICVDEYQDTNYAQEEIYTNISNGNNLFMVGDSKQSIYGFRLSEPKILLDKFNDYKASPEHGKTVMLDFNYRSDKGIVEFVNAIFNEVMTKEFGGIDYKKDDQLQYKANYAKEPMAPSYEIHIFEEKEKEKAEKKSFDEVYSVRDDHSSGEEISTAYQEGLFIANKIIEIVNNYKIYDPKIEDMRSVKYSDIALLARSGSGSVREIVKAIQDKLIPIDIAPLLKEEGVYEVEIVKDMLRLVANDMQDYPLTAILVSYWVGMDYEDLRQIRASQPKAEYFWQAVRLNKSNNVYVKKFYDLLDELRLKASYMSIKDLADSIVFDYGFDKYIMTLEGGDFKLSALKTYLATLSDLSSDCSLWQYVSTLTNGKMEIKGGADGNMVKAMTIHKSKGLEFPVVFVCNIDKELNGGGGQNAPKLKINKDAGIAINYFDEKNMVVRKNLAYNVLSEKNTLAEKAEAMRLFYVALTRPKNHIILTGCAKKDSLVAKNPFKANSFLDWIMISAKNNQKVGQSITLHSDVKEKANAMARYSFAKYVGEDIPIIDKYLNFEYPYKNAENTSIKYTVTEINKQGGNKNDFLEEEEIVVENDLTAQVDRAKRGTNYHAVLENIDFNARSVNEVEAELYRMVDSGIITAEDMAEIDKKEIVAILNTDVIDYARKNKCYKEQEFTLHVSASEIMDTKVNDQVFVQGTIDLLIVGEEVWVVDYKKTNEKTSVLKERYKKQLQIYSKAVEKGIGRKVDKAMLLIIGRSEVIDIPIND